MSNLWKALRDVSRDVEPTVGFEPPAQGSKAESPGPEEPTGPSDPGNASADNAPPAGPRAPSSAPRPRPVSSPPSSGTKSPGTKSSGTKSSGTNEPGSKERRAPLQSPLRRNPNGNSANIVRPPQFTPDRDDDTDIVAHLSRVLDSMSAAAPAVAKTPPQDGDGASSAGPSKPIWARTAPTSVPGSPRPAAPRSSSNGASRPKASNPGASGYRNPGAGSPSFGSSGPGNPDGRGPTLVPNEPSADFGPIPGVADSDKTASDPAGYNRNAGPSSDAGRSPATTRTEGYGQPSTSGPALSAPSGLPESLKAFAPGAPDTQMEVAAIVGSPRWRPGDDDVIPGDGRKGLRRPRLRDRLGI